MEQAVKVKISSNVSIEKGPFLIVLKKKSELKTFLRKLKVTLFDWQEKKISSEGMTLLEVKKGVLGVCILREKDSSTPGGFEPKSYGFFRDEVMGFLRKGSTQKITVLTSDELKEDALEGLGAGFSLASYDFKKETKLSVSIEKGKAKAIKRGVVKGEAVNMARKLVDLPPNVLKPNHFKDLIVEEFSKQKDFTVKVLDRKKIESQNYGLILGVGQASDEGPYLVHVSYKPNGATKSIGCVGKGITFDTGGLDLKPPSSMRWMKKDMGGAATLFGFAKSVKDTRPQVSIDFVFAIAENAVGSNAFRPGDVLTAQNGKTVEIHNTDAEGRLALASGFNYLSTLKKKFDVCFNVATLTGAIKYGLGARVGGLFSNDMELGASIQKAGENSDDPVWLMPLPHWTGSRLNSPIADIVNCTDGYGGAISAAEFLRIFVPEKTPWFHLDLYCWTDGARGPYLKKGATGQGVQLLQNWIETL